MKKKVWTVLGGIGFFLLLAATSAMDSEQIMIPVAMALIGVTLCCLSAKALMGTDQE